MQIYDADLLYCPDDPALRYLPEGPYPCGQDRMSWVAIQHGDDAQSGSLNVLDLRTRQNVSHPLSGRPGFAFPTGQPDTFVIGLERHLVLFNTQSGEVTALSEEVDRDVEGTIINDGLVFEQGLIFGCKDLQFQDPKAGLYLWRARDGRLVRLRSDQICSNGKALYRQDGELVLLDIDSPRKTIVSYKLDVESATLGPSRVVVDLRQQDRFPDGMILTPDENSVIVALYDPHDAPFGEAHQYSIHSGQLEAVWRTGKSPRVTCPQLVQVQDQIKLALTTAVESMGPQSQARHSNAGCLFLGDTRFDRLPPQPVFTQ